ncbi:MAG: hypothetical protein ACI8S6_003258 [Myxococcota bacterium]|jgi:hypothetical protein
MTASMKNGIIRLHGRQYKTVALRVQEFRIAHPISEGWAIVTNLIHCNADNVLFRATITDPQGREIAVGYAEEQRTAKGINATSALENCETSAIGRALAAAGYAGTEYASADELVNALNQQRNIPNDSSNNNSAPPARSERNHHPSWTRDHKQYIAELKARTLTYEQVANFCEARSWGRPASWTTEERARFLDDLDRGSFKDLYVPKLDQEPVFVPDNSDLSVA